MILFYKKTVAIFIIIIYNLDVAKREFILQEF